MDMRKELLRGILGEGPLEGLSGNIGWDVNGSIGQMMEELRAGVDKLNLAQEFVIGEIVTPKRHSNKKGRGKPWIVLAKTDLTYISDESGRPIKGCDIIVGVIVDKELLRYHNFSGDFELFDKDKVEA